MKNRNRLFDLTLEVNDIDVIWSVRINRKLLFRYIQVLIKKNLCSNSSPFRFHLDIWTKAYFILCIVIRISNSFSFSLVTLSVLTRLLFIYERNFHLCAIVNVAILFLLSLCCSSVVFKVSIVQYLWLCTFISFFFVHCYCFSFVSLWFTFWDISTFCTIFFLFLFVSNALYDKFNIWKYINIFSH